MKKNKKYADGGVFPSQVKKVTKKQGLLTTTEEVPTNLGYGNQDIQPLYPHSATPNFPMPQFAANPVQKKDANSVTYELLNHAGKQVYNPVFHGDWNDKAKMDYFNSSPDEMYGNRILKGDSTSFVTPSNQPAPKQLPQYAFPTKQDAYYPTFDLWGNDNQNYLPILEKGGKMKKMPDGGDIAPIQTPTKRSISYETLQRPDHTTMYAPQFNGDWSYNDVKSAWNAIPENMNGTPVVRGDAWNALYDGIKPGTTSSQWKRRVSNQPVKMLNDIGNIVPQSGSFHREVYQDQTVQPITDQSFNNTVVKMPYGGSFDPYDFSGYNRQPMQGLPNLQPAGMQTIPTQEFNPQVQPIEPDQPVDPMLQNNPAPNKQKKSGSGFTTPGTGDLLAAGLQMAANLLPEHQQSNMYHKRNFGGYNPNMYGTGSQAIYANGGDITGNNLQVEDNKFTALSPHTIMINGDSHADGGTMVQYGNNVVEAEKGEPLSIGQDGNAVIWGAMNVPGTKKKFKQVGEMLGKEETKNIKLKDKAVELLNNSDPIDASQSFAFNSGKALQDAAIQKSKVVSATKEKLSAMQEAMLQIADMKKIDPSNMRNGGTIEKARKGKTLRNVADEDLVAEVAKKYGIDEDVAQRIVFQESGYNPHAVSNAGAMGLMQFLPETAKQYGLTRAQLTSSNPDDKRAVVDAGLRHFKSLLGNNNNDYKLALAAYNAGQGTVNDFIKGSGKKKSDYTGDDLMARMQWKRDNQPSENNNLAQYQTYDYINNIFGKSYEDFYGKNGRPSTGKQFNATYYAPPENQWNPHEVLTPVQELSPVDHSSNSTFTPPTPQAIPIQMNGAPVTPPVKKTSLADRNKPKLSNFLGEIGAIFDQPDPVKVKHFQPDLFDPYQVSFQDKLNENQATFNSLADQLPGNASALSVLAGQKYQQDESILGDQFRTNQAIANDVTNKNIGLLNQAQQTNLGIDDQQYVRQTQAQANTRAHQNQAFASISDKLNQNRIENMGIRLMENRFDYRPDANMKMVYMGDNVVFNPGTGQYHDATTGKVVQKTSSDGTSSTTVINDPLEAQKVEIARKKAEGKWLR